MPTIEDLKELFINANGQMIVRLQIDDDEGLMQIIRWHRGEIDPLPGILCREVLFHNFSVETERKALQSQIVENLFEDLVETLRERLKSLGTVTVLKEPIPFLPPEKL